MTDGDQSHGTTHCRSLTVNAMARLATRQLTTAQLVDLIGLLELELITRCTPATDWLVDERPRLRRRAPSQ